MMQLFKVGYQALLDSLSEEPGIEAADNSVLSNSMWDAPGLFGGGVGTQSGEVVSSVTAQTVPAFFACVKVISEDVGKLPLVPYKRVGINQKELMESGSITRVLLKRPSPNSVPMIFKELITGWALAWGNGYAEIVRNSRKEPTELWPIHPSRVQIRRNSDGNLFYIIRFQDGSSTAIAAEDMLHIRGPGDELYGWNLPVSIAKDTLGSAMAQIIFAASFFGNSVTPAGVLTHPESLKDEGQRRLRESMQRFYGGPRNAAKLLVLDEGMEYKPMSMPLKDAQFLESRNFSVEEIARYFRMPLHKIQSMKQSTNNNIEQQALEYTQDTLMPWLIRWEEEINLKFFPNTENSFVKFDLDEMLRGDFDSQTEGFSRLFATGVLSINEIRARMDMNPVDDGDVHYVPLNMVTLEQSQQAPDDLDSKRDNRRDIDNTVAAKFTPVIKAAMSTLVTKEAKAVTKAYSKNPDTCADDMKGFYERHALQMFEAIWPVTESYFSLLSSVPIEDTNMEKLLADFCGSLCDFSRTQIVESSKMMGEIKTLTDSWIQSRAAYIATEIVSIGLATTGKAIKLIQKENQGA